MGRSIEPERRADPAVVMAAILETAAHLQGNLLSDQ